MHQTRVELDEFHPLQPVIILEWRLRITLQLQLLCIAHDINLFMQSGNDHSIFRSDID